MKTCSKCRENKTPESFYIRIIVRQMGVIASASYATTLKEIALRKEITISAFEKSILLEFFPKRRIIDKAILNLGQPLRTGKLEILKK